MTPPADDGSAGFTAAPMRARSAPADQTLTERHKAAVERLERIADLIVAELDLIYGEPDREDGGDKEPNLGSLGSGSALFDQARWARGSQDERELDPAEEEYSSGWAEAMDQRNVGGGDQDSEPSLGAINPTPSGDQRTWSGVAADQLSGLIDGEGEHDGREDVSEDEGAQCEDEGGACEDEGAASGDDELSLGWTVYGGQGPRRENLADAEAIRASANVGDEHL